VRRLRHRAEEEGRSDDTDEGIRHRQAVYREQTAPILGLFRDRGLLAEVDGLGSPDEVLGRVLDALLQNGVGANA
ncbi:MAG TPA: adenylate kinase, partial [Microbacteriaceae bacterium]|nr:adenylate kinase [Microbacteriaceae bacterium]